MSSGHQRITWRRNIAENFNLLSRVHERYRQTDDRVGQTDDRRQTDGRRHIANMNMSSRSIKKLCPALRYELRCQIKYSTLFINKTSVNKTAKVALITDLMETFNLGSTCACKGIRHCLLCEDPESQLKQNSLEATKVVSFALPACLLIQYKPRIGPI